jgi:hypothetical protein
MSEAAPDYLEPLVGWRLWSIAWRDGRARLGSPVHSQEWEPGEEFHAACHAERRERWRPWRFAPVEMHAVPGDGCTCGVYALGRPDHLMEECFQPIMMEYRFEYRVIGRVSLWGDIVEASRGWRASIAYPAELWLPEMEHRRRASFDLARAARDLGDYGIPVHLCAPQTPRQVLAGL